MNYYSKRKIVDETRTVVLYCSDKDHKIVFEDASNHSIYIISKEYMHNVSKFLSSYCLQPNRTYYLEDPEGFALEWCRAIEEMRVHCYGLQETTAA